LRILQILFRFVRLWLGSFLLQSDKTFPFLISLPCRLIGLAAEENHGATN
jgi:hypothetical protein